MTKLQVAMFQFLRFHLTALALRRLSTTNAHGAQRQGAALEPTPAAWGLGEVAAKICKDDGWLQGITCR